VPRVHEEPPPGSPLAPLGGWLTSAGCDAAMAVALAGDVSPRLYFRVARGSGSAILALYPEAMRETQERFLRSGALLAAAGVRVPRVLAHSAELGATLLEDLGARTLYDAGEDWPALLAYFHAALDGAARLAEVDRDAVAALNPALDTELLGRELEKTRTMFLEPRALLEHDQRQAWEAFVAELCAAIGAEPTRPCHRDFMARNLVPVAGLEVAVLDHQDLRLGPPTYDVASLLNDSLFPPPAAEEKLLEHAGLAQGEPRQRYRRAAVQRGLKAVGTFAAFAARGAPRHLPLIAPTGARVLRHLGALPERRLLPPAFLARLAGAFCYTE
jgi:hypothetical protein